MARILTPAEWDALAAAEAPMYLGNPGASAVTDCCYREDSADLAGMWDAAMPGVEMLIGFDDEIPDEAAAVLVVAQRVASAQHYLVFGDLPTVKP